MLLYALWTPPVLPTFPPHPVVQVLMEGAHSEADLLFSCRLSIKEEGLERPSTKRSLLAPSVFASFENHKCAPM